MSSTSTENRFRGLPEHERRFLISHIQRNGRLAWCILLISHAVLDTYQCGQVTFFSSSASSSMASWPPSLMGPRSYKGGRRLPTL